jgi:tetratricopeptide (TPR) repeat protein
MDYVDAIYSIGKRCFGENAAFFVQYASYQHYILKDNKKALLLVNTARKNHPEQLTRFAIFVASRDWNADTSSGDEYMTAISEQQLNENLPIAMEYHNQAKQALREFWENLQRPQPDFSRINPLLAKLYYNQKEARDRYERLLTEYPNSPKVLRNYGSLLFEVFHDDEASENLLSTAKELEDEARERQGLPITGGDQAGDAARKAGDGLDSAGPSADAEGRSKDAMESIGQLSQRAKKKKKKTTTQAAAMMGMELGANKPTSTNTYFLLLLLLFLLLGGGFLAAYLVSSNFCKIVLTHIASFYETGRLMTIIARITSMSKIGMSIHKGHINQAAFGIPDADNKPPDLETVYWDFTRLTETLSKIM